MRPGHSLIAALALVVLGVQPLSAKDPETESKATTKAATASDPAKDKAKKDTAKKETQAAQDNKADSNAAGTNVDTAETSMALDEPADATPPPRMAVAAPALSATDKWAPAGLAIVLAALFAGLVGWILNKKIKQLEANLASLAEKQKSQSAELSRIRNAGNQDGADGYAAPAKPAYSATNDARREPQVAPPPPAPSPAPPVSRLPDRLDQIRQEIAAMILSPGLKSNEYDAALAKFGSVYGVQVSADGSSAQLIATDRDSARRLSAIHLADEGVAVILPSSRYVKEFAMTFKESLEAGSDVKMVFDCRVDGSATLKLQRLAFARVDSAMYLGGLTRGELAGYIG